MPTLSAISLRRARPLSSLLIALTLAVLPLFVFASPVAAEEPAGITSASLWVYPEYDDPRLLVMLQGTVPQSTKLPVTVRFLVPIGAEMYSAGSMDAQGRYKGGPPDRKAAEVAGWDEISYELTANTFRVEYYLDAITGLPDKTIAYEFRTLYPIDSLAVEILQPAKASGFKISPESQSKGSFESMTYFAYRYASVGVEKPVSFNISYSKADSVPSVKPQQSGSGAAQSGSPNLIWLLGLGAGTVFAVGAIWYTGQRRRYRPAPRRNAALASRQSSALRRSSSSPAASQAGQRSARSEKGSSGAKARQAFCRRCGEKLEGTSRFCKHCGTRIE